MGKKGGCSLRPREGQCECRELHFVSCGSNTASSHRTLSWKPTATDTDSVRNSGYPVISLVIYTHECPNFKLATESIAQLAESFAKDGKERKERNRWVASCLATGRRVRGDKRYWDGAGRAAQKRTRFLSLSLSQLHHPAKRHPAPTHLHYTACELQGDGSRGFWQSPGPVALLYQGASLLEIRVCPADVMPIEVQWGWKSGRSSHDTHLARADNFSGFCALWMLLLCLLSSLVWRSFGTCILTIFTKTWLGLSSLFHWFFSCFLLITVML